MGFYFKLFLALQSLTPSWAEGSMDPVTYQFCTQSPVIDFNPFRAFKDFRELHYLMLTVKPYIDSDGGPGLLKSWHFSPDGKALTAEINPSALWTDGTRLSSLEAAIGIAYGLPFRELGARVKVPGVPGLTLQNLLHQLPGSIEILDSERFRLHFESDIKALTGVLIDALSSGSRHNKLWPLRLKNVEGGFQPDPYDVVGKYPRISFTAKRPVIHLPTNDIELQAISVCSDPDFTPHRLLPGQADNEFGHSLTQSAAVNYGVFLSGEKFTLSQRRQIAQMLRYALAMIPSQSSFVPDQFFQKGEPGWTLPSDWPKIKPQKVTPFNVTIATSNPVPANSPFRRILEKLTQSAGSKIEWKDFDYHNVTPEELKSIDVIIAGGRAMSGRQIWLQDLTGTPALRKALTARQSWQKQFPKTVGALESIAKKSSSTIPINHEDLARFNRAAVIETSLFPLIRRPTAYYYRLSTGVKISVSKSDEPYFEEIAL